MRFEAKNSYFKEMAHVIGNYKNIAKTLALRHQRLSCYYLQGEQNDTEYGKGTFKCQYFSSTTCNR